jgi:hypothetical protein
MSRPTPSLEMLIGLLLEKSRLLKTKGDADHVGLSLQLQFSSHGHSLRIKQSASQNNNSLIAPNLTEIMDAPVESTTMASPTSKTMEYRLKANMPTLPRLEHAGLILEASKSTQLAQLRDALHSKLQSNLILSEYQLTLLTGANMPLEYSITVEEH